MRQLLVSLFLPLMSVHVPTLAQVKVPTLDHVLAAFHTEEARLMYERVATAPGAAPQDFGTPLPISYKPESLLQQLAPGQSSELLATAGALRWPQRPGMDAAMVCLAPRVETAERYRMFTMHGCDADSQEKQDSMSLWLGVFISRRGEPPVLVARTHEQVSVPVSWADSNIPQPRALERSTEGTPVLRCPSSWRRFDMTSYPLRPGDGDGGLALGLRASWDEEYKGGGANFEMLYLFMMDGARLRPVFARPMAFIKAESTGVASEREVWETVNMLTVLPQTRDGYADIELRERNGTWQRVFKWSSLTGMYE
ncbi:Hypothetical protein mma_0460 [Janthinobacterium sp. Marseille]|nr:hypothetical protein [Janthinobacterium sp. Marseille]ABR90923.1 Hypothetical protein mma_0460 [Janthinobacterium sp. Marseille]